MAIDKVQLVIDGQTEDMSLQGDDSYSTELVADKVGKHNVQVYAYDTAGNVTVVETDRFPVLMLNVEQWKPPKVNWVQKDYFNIEDYNRIKGNLEYLQMLGCLLYPTFYLSDMGEVKAYYDWIYADEINKFEDNLEEVKKNTYPLEIGQKQEFFANEAFITFEELNRIESACLAYYNLLQGQKKNKSRLTFKLGNRRGVRT